MMKIPYGWVAGANTEPDAESFMIGFMVRIDGAVGAISDSRDGNNERKTSCG
jgi:hypothetical protein